MSTDNNVKSIKVAVWTYITFRVLLILIGLALAVALAYLAGRIIRGS